MSLSLSLAFDPLSLLTVRPRRSHRTRSGDTTTLAWCVDSSSSLYPSLDEPDEADSPLRRTQVHALLHESAKQGKLTSQIDEAKVKMKQRVADKRAKGEAMEED